VQQSVVVDANVAVKWLLVEEDSAKARVLLDTARYHLIVPDLLYGEVLNVIWQYHKHKKIDEEEAIVAARVLKNTQCEVVSMRDHLYMTLRIAMKLGVKATYDCFYLAVADWEDALLVTADAKFARAAAASDLSHRIRLLDEV
jgi:predicted nucleic acid-binding protein